MRRQFRMFLGIPLVLGVAISAIAVWAQEKQPAGDKATIERQRSTQAPQAPQPPHDRLVFERHIQGPPVGPLPPGGPGDFIFLATEMSFGGKVVKGAPYSAQAITESTQTLSDGNRIVNKSTASLFRDSEGRTRREQTMRVIGPFANAGDAPTTIFLNDPVAGTSYTLDPQNRIARKIPPMRLKIQTHGPAPEGGKQLIEPHEGPPVRLEMHPEIMHKRKLEAGVAIGLVSPMNDNAKTESLGRQNIEGVDAEGTRTTVTIAAGEIGNERPIEIVSERWYSQELQTVVMTRHSDPRFGENTYRLTNINRSEPAKSLFEVPGDYTVKEGPPAPEPIRMRMKKPEVPQ